MNAISKNLYGRVVAQTSLSVLLVVSAFVSRADETCGTCSRSLDVVGQFTHYRIGDDQGIHGAAPGEEAAFREEIYGSAFTVSVPHLPAGKYTVIIGETEAYFTES